MLHFRASCTRDIRIQRIHQPQCVRRLPACRHSLAQSRDFSARKGCCPEGYVQFICSRNASIQSLLNPAAPEQAGCRRLPTPLCRAGRVPALLLSTFRPCNPGPGATALRRAGPACAHRHQEAGRRIRRMARKPSYMHMATADQPCPPTHAHKQRSWEGQELHSSQHTHSARHCRHAHSAKAHLHAIGHNLGLQPPPKQANDAVLLHHHLRGGRAAVAGRRS